MDCIKTGCDAYIHTMGAMVHGDLFEHDGVLVLNATGCYAPNYDTNKGHIVLYRAERVGNSEVFVCNKKQATELHDFHVELFE